MDSENIMKICEVCGREIEFRKKWAKTFDQIKYCSEKGLIVFTQKGHVVDPSTAKGPIRLKLIKR